MFLYEGEVGTHKLYDGTQHPWEFKRIWHLEPSLTDPDTVYAGAEDAAIVQNHRRRQDVEGAARTAQREGASLAAGRGRHGFHTIILDPKNANRIFIAISAAGAFRTDDGGQNLEADQSRAEVAIRTARPGRGSRSLRASHRHAPVASGRVVHAKALGHHAHDNAGESWSEVSGNLPSDFGFPIDVHAHEPETIYVVPITSDSLHYPPDGKLRVYRSKTGGNEWEALTKGLPQKDCYVNVLRDAMAVDALDACGIYFGTTGGQVYCSADSGDTWNADCARSAGRVVRRSADVAVKPRMNAQRARIRFRW